MKFLDSGIRDDRAEADLLRPSVWLKLLREVLVARNREVARSMDLEQYEPAIITKLVQRENKPPLYELKLITSKRKRT